MATTSTYQHRHGMGFDVHDHGIHSGCSPHGLGSNPFCVGDRNPDSNHGHTRKPSKTQTITYQKAHLGSPEKAHSKTRGTTRHQTDGPGPETETASQVRERLGEKTSPEAGAALSAIVSQGMVFLLSRSGSGATFVQ